ncbi:MAG TPA: hypothetical protein VEH56_01285 [Candidatus Saccharimonadales bacterium]|nr:hypothetical protein [Candidatus Saccharimonadales bacterium]
MTTPDQQLTKRLADMKSFLEKRIKVQEEEVNSLRSFLEVIDSLLAERSFRQVEIPKTATTSQKITLQHPDSIPVMTVDGVRIASMLVENNVLQIFPEANVRLDSNSPPLRSFLIGKVLEPMQSKDKESASQGSLAPERILTYDLDEENGTLKAIRVQNYGDERRLLELKNAVRWTFRRMYEKSIKQ